MLIDYLVAKAPRQKKKIAMSYQALQNLDHFPVAKDKNKTSFAVTLFFAT